MIYKNVHYQSRPDKVEITVKGRKAVVEIPVNVTESATEDGREFIAEKVYVVITKPTKNLKKRVESDLYAWINAATIQEPEPETTIADVVEAINALTDIVLGGDDDD